MEPIGQKFKDARKEKGLFIEQVARETNISKKYIEAIEEELFADFPGETYLLGFLRSYASYLGLDPEEIISIYKKTQIQEQPVPVELTEKKHAFPVIPVAVAAAALLLISGGIYFFMFSDIASQRVVKEKTTPVEATPVETFNGVEYEMNNTFIERRFANKDSVLMNFKNSPYKIGIAETSGDKVALVLPSGKVELEKGGDVLIDLDGDGSNDLRATVRDIDASGQGAVLRLDRNTEAPLANAQIPGSEDDESPVIAQAENTPAPVAGTTTVQSRKQNIVPVLEAEEMQPFRINLTFRGYCLMRYEADGGTREERYFHKGDNFRLDVSNQIAIWLSNSAAVNAKINNTEYNFGTAGSVSSKLIGWNKNQSGGYVINSTPLY